MTLFYFDVDDGSLPPFQDTEGVEFDRLEAAEHEAIITAAEMAKDRSNKGPGMLTIAVRDGSGVRSTITVTMAVNRP